METSLSTNLKNEVRVLRSNISSNKDDPNQKEVRVSTKTPPSVHEKG